MLSCVDSCQTMARYSRGGWAARGYGRLAVVVDMQRESTEEAARKKAPDSDPGGFDSHNSRSVISLVMSPGEEGVLCRTAASGRLLGGSDRSLSESSFGARAVAHGNPQALSAAPDESAISNLLQYCTAHLILQQSVLDSRPRVCCYNHLRHSYCICTSETLARAPASSSPPRRDPHRSAPPPRPRLAYWPATRRSSTAALQQPLATQHMNCA